MFKPILNMFLDLRGSSGPNLTKAKKKLTIEMWSLSG